MKLSALIPAAAFCPSVAGCATKSPHEAARPLRLQRAQRGVRTARRLDLWTQFDRGHSHPDAQQRRPDFSRDARCHPRREAVDQLRDLLAPVGTARAATALSSPWNGQCNAELLLQVAVASARKSLLIEHAYFLPDSALADQFCQAAQRGVKVQDAVEAPLESHL